MKEKINLILNAFLDTIEIKEVKIIQSGLINSTYQINTLSGQFILQQLNQNVFHNIKTLIDNKIKITQYLINIGFPTVTYLQTKQGLYFYKNDNEIWQLSIFIPSVIKEKIDSTIIAKHAGKHLAQFHEALLDFPIDELGYTIPDFHNTIKRYEDFLNQIKTASKDRLDFSKNEIEKNNHYYSKIKKVAMAIQQKTIPVRVVHNDTKISNMLFDEFEKIICIIDYDTVMPGSILHDVGDALRSGTNTSTEDEVDLNLVNFNSNIYDAFMKSYLKKAKSFMTKDEIENIHLSLPLLLFEQSCRFLDDYLNHDKYYVVKYDTQNLIRTKTQLRLLDQVCDYLKI